MLWPNCSSPCSDRIVGVRVGGGGVDAYGVGGQLVDAEGLLVQVAFQAAEGIATAQSCEQVSEAVIMGTVTGRTSLPSRAERVPWCWATQGST